MSSAATARPDTPDAPLVDLVLPCLDEASALAWLLPRVPEGVRAIVVDNGSTDGSADVALSHGAVVVREERRGFGAACHAGLEAATADVVAFMDADATLDPEQLDRVLDPVLTGASDLVLGRRRAASLRAWPWHLRLANRELMRRLRRRTHLDLHDLGPMRAGRREALLRLGLQDRRSGYPLEMVVRAADAGWHVTEVDVDYAHRIGRSKVTGTPLGVARAVRDMSAVLDTPPTGGPTAATGHSSTRTSGRAAAAPVEPPRTLVLIAKDPVPGLVKTRLQSEFTPGQAAALAEASLRDTVDALQRVVDAGADRAAGEPGTRLHVALAGDRGRWVPSDADVSIQPDGGLDVRLAAAFRSALADGHGPALLVGMDTPQLAPTLAEVDFTGVDAVIGLTDDGGFWAIGLRVADDDVFLDVPMSTDHTGSDQLDRLRGLGLRVRVLPSLRDVDEPADAREVAALAPDTRFAAAWRSATGTTTSAAAAEVAGGAQGGHRPRSESGAAGAATSVASTGRVRR